MLPLGSCRPGEQIWGWLATICHNEVGSYCRTWRGAGRKLQRKSVSDIELNEVVTRGTNCKVSKDILQLETAELLAILNECLDRLPPQHREAIDLRFFEQLTDREAARKIGTAASTITKRAKAAITQLRKLLGERGVEGA